MNIFNKKEVINSGFELLQGWCTGPVMNTFGLSLWKTFRNECSKKKRTSCWEVQEIFPFRLVDGSGEFFGEEVFHEVIGIALDEGGNDVKL